MQWLKAFFDANSGPTKAEDYDPVARRNRRKGLVDWKLVLSFRLIVEGRMTLIYLFRTTIWIHLRVKSVSRVSMINSVDVRIAERKYGLSKVHVCVKKRNKVQDVSMCGDCLTLDAGAKGAPRNSRSSPKGSRNHPFHMPTWMSLTSPSVYPPALISVPPTLKPNCNLQHFTKSYENNVSDSSPLKT